MLTNWMDWRSTDPTNLQLFNVFPFSNEFWYLAAEVIVIYSPIFIKRKVENTKNNKSIRSSLNG